ncbi:hypothetical protein B0H14DRAFT_3173314 [Mycena olivaceomarginata]|nr:hypothetical protein B0H14DRAFT_3173314 [Mycena olivaceomarginata]
MFILDNWFLSDGCTLRELFILSGWRDGEETKLADAEASDSDGQQHAYGQYGADTSGLRSLQRWTRQHSRSKERWRLELRAVNSLRPSRRPTRSGCIASAPLLTTVFLLLAYCGDGHVKAQKTPRSKKIPDYGFSFGFSPAPTSHGSSDGRRPIVYRLSVAIESRISRSRHRAALLRRYIIPPQSSADRVASQNKFTARPLVDQFCGPPIRGGIVQLACTNIVTRQIEGKSLALGITTCTPQPDSANTAAPCITMPPPDAFPPRPPQSFPRRKRISPLFPFRVPPAVTSSRKRALIRNQTVRNFLYRQKFNAPVPASAGNASLLSNKFGASGLCVFQRSTEAILYNFFLRVPLFSPEAMEPAAPDSSRERAARAADRSRIADIDAQILKLERTISSLKEEKDSLRGQLATYTYPVLTLPNEIVSEIFVQFLPDFPGTLRRSVFYLPTFYARYAANGGI